MAPTLELFRGDGRGEKPHYRLKKLQGLMSYDMKEEGKLYRFEMGLAPGTVAEKWWDTLDPKEQKSWTELMKAFKKRWPAPVEAKESTEELKSRIKSTILKSEDLGKLVGPPGDEMYAHLRWATDMRPLVEAINDPTMLLKGDVRATLPLEVRVVLPPTGLTTWELFFTAIENIDSERVQDELERSGKHRKHGLVDINREIDGFDPDRTGTELAAYVQHLMTMMPTTYAELIAPIDTATTATAPYGTELAVTSETRSRDTTHTPNGLQQYQTDLAAWNTRYSPTSGLAPDYATLPLTPGTLPAGSKECWSCGQVTNPPHFGVAKCRLAGNSPVPQLESNVRALIGNALFPPGERTPSRFTHISQIDTADVMNGYNALGLFDIHQMLFEDQEEGESGNGEGLA
ncbi:hypothetical protein C8J57DRAFT_1578857 [Mycena rebaudengoi]|nr:hypothetical protein C8J57DRAFT_1578857 [Mycena rebaudengoi]